MFAIVLALVPQQHTYVVDDGGGTGVDFTDLPDAIATAANGDVLLVRAGDYSHFELAGKGLHFLGETGARVVDPGSGQPSTTISAVPGDSLVFIERLDFVGAASPLAGLAISGSSTRVVLSETDVTGAVNVHFTPAILVSEARLMLQDSTVVGGRGFSPSPSIGGGGGQALRADLGARVHVVGSDVTGGNGVAGQQSPGSGATALVLASQSRTWAVASVLRGGSGAVSPSGAIGGGGRGVSLVDDSFARISGGADDLVAGGFGWCPSALGIAASAGGRSVVHAVPILLGSSFPPGGCTSGPQTSGFDDADPLPILEVGGTFTPAGSVTIELHDGPPFAPFAIKIDDATHPQALTRIPVRPGGVYVGEVLVAPLDARTLVSGQLSAQGDFSTTLPCSALGFVPYAPFLLQAGINQGRSVLMSNGIVRVLRQEEALQAAPMPRRAMIR